MSKNDLPSSSFSINAQYVKDLSFENPNPFKSLSSDIKNQPEISINIDVGARGIGTDVYEVNIRIIANATREKEKVYVVDLDYAGVFTLDNVQQDQVAPLLLIEGPRFLFPFARNIIAEATRDGGFSPLALAPVDFLSLYQNQHGKHTGSREETKVSSSSSKASKKQISKPKSAPKIVKKKAKKN